MTQTLTKQITADIKIDDILMPVDKIDTSPPPARPTLTPRQRQLLQILTTVIKRQ